jgi:Sulfotransferase family
MSPSPHNLDFIVIGVQKGGTTSLWQYLRCHPQICMSRPKEAAFFCAERQAPKETFDAYMRRVFYGAPPNALFGTATPRYMMGAPNRPAGSVAERIHDTLPTVKLIALLRDPIDRMVSQYQMAVSRGHETRSLDVAARELLEPEELERGRSLPNRTNAYIVQGEYGRILNAYSNYFPPDRLLTVFTHNLRDDPGLVLDAIMDFLGLASGFRPPELEMRHFQSGGRKRLDPEGERLLFNFFKHDVLPYMHGDRDTHRRAFSFFYDSWSRIPGDRPASVSPDIRSRLEEHFRADAEGLASLDISAPWISSWDE